MIYFIIKNLTSGQNGFNKYKRLKVKIKYFKFIINNILNVFLFFTLEIICNIDKNY
jgi:hypothetical protein